MHGVDPALEQAIFTTSVEALPRAVARFEYNLLASSTINTPDNGKGDLFPNDSLLYQRYTDSGLPRAIVGQAYANSKEDDVQFRAVSEDDIYKYWVSPTLSTASSISDAWAEIIYDHARLTNTICAVFEVSYAAPTSVDVSVRINGSWQQVASGLAPDANGVLEIYAQESGWGTNKVLGNEIEVEGVRIDVNSMSKADVYLHLINLSGCLLVDLSDRITEFGINKAMENVSILSPIGDASVHTANLTLENEDGALTPQDASEFFYGLMSRNVAFDLSEFIGGQYEVPQGRFYAESWGYESPSVTADVECSDMTRFMQETMMQPFVLRGYTVKQAVREILQRAGFNIDTYIVDSNPVIPFIWYNERISVWQALRDVANATMAYFYINSHNELVWIDFASLSSSEVEETLDATDKLISVSHTFEVMSNSVNVEYNIYGTPIDPVTKDPITQELWTAEQDEALLSMPLDRDFDATDQYIYIDTDDDGFAMWPQSGLVAIQGEYIRYDGKNDTAKRLVVTARGQAGTAPKSHTTQNLGAYFTIGPEGLHYIRDGNLRMTGPSRATFYNYAMSLFGDASSAFKVYGTSVRLDDRGDQTAGLIINRTPVHGGLYAEISTTPFSTKRNKPEIRVYRRHRDTGELTVLGTAQYQVAAGNWYDIEVTVQYTTVQPTYAVYVNGMHVATFQEEWLTQGQYGPYIRGDTRADFSRVYASSGAVNDYKGSTFQDVNSGSSFSSDYIFHTGDPNIAVNEFAPQVRQVKEYNIDYSIFPATQAAVLNTNIWQARVMRFIPSPFGATFLVENKSAETAVINGESPNLFEEPVDMHLLVYGVPVIVDSEENKSVRDDLSIRRHGLVELEVSNPWIQTDEMAERIADLIVDNFSDPMDVIEATVINHPLLELGDVVAVDYEEEGYSADTHLYYILGINTSWSDGFEQTLTLRRKR